MPHDPIAAKTVSIAEHREPVFHHAAQVDGARRRLVEFTARTGRKPNVLVVLMDDVGWGDFGCYGGGVAVGAPTPHIDRLAQDGLRLTSCYSEPSCTPSRASLLTGRLLDPKETRSYLIRKLAYLESFQSGMRNHLATFKKYPPKVVVGLGG